MPPGLRLFVRRLVFFPMDLLTKKRDLIPPAGLIYTGRGDFLKAGQYWLDTFKKYAGLREDSKVLDIGSGIGRIAVGLTPYLKGKYEGFDAVRQGVDWCQQNISTKFPNFNFTYADLYNDLYKKDGILAASFTFPYPENRFDMACAISVFTHMIPEEVEQYISETSRVIVPGGYLVATFFVLNDESRQSMLKGKFQFQYDYGHFALMDEKVKSANVAYDQEYLFRLVQEKGWVINKFLPGYWCGREKTEGYDFQDIMILRRSNI